MTLYPRSGSDALPPETRSGSDALNVFERLKRNKRRRAYGRRAPTGPEKKEKAAGKKKAVVGEAGEPGPASTARPYDSEPSLDSQRPGAPISALPRNPPRKAKDPGAATSELQTALHSKRRQSRHTPALKMSRAFKALKSVPLACARTTGLNGGHPYASQVLERLSEAHRPPQAGLLRPNPPRRPCRPLERL